MVQGNEGRSIGVGSSSSTSGSASAAANQVAAATKKGKSKSVTPPSDKPKQPQRGLGVAQLEKIRLHGQLASSGFLPNPHFPSHPPFQHHHIHEDMRMFQTPTAFGYPSPPLGSPSSYAYGHPVNNYMMGAGDPLGRTIQPFHAPRWNPNNTMIRIPESQQYMQQPSMVTRHLLGQVEQESRRNALMGSMSSSGQNSEPKDNEELDLELKL